jgi:hypothetical protein
VGGLFGTEDLRTLWYTCVHKNGGAYGD